MYLHAYHSLGSIVPQAILETRRTDVGVSGEATFTHLAGLHEVTEGLKIDPGATILDADGLVRIDTATPGDTDRDGDVDAFDYVTLKRSTGRSDGVGWGDGDFDASGCVDRGDFLALRANFAGPAAAAVPAPAALPLLAFGTLVVLRRRPPTRRGR